MANQLIGLFNPNATTFQKVRDSIILVFKLKRVTANREQIIKAAEQWGWDAYRRRSPATACHARAVPRTNPTSRKTL